MIGPLRLRGPGWMILPLALAFGLAFAASADAALTYSVSSDLKKAGCAGDIDNDCLDNTEENNLAWAAAPWYFYDEAEDCSGWQNRFGLSSNHFARQDFFQLRPDALNVQSWSPTDGQAKWVRITYFFVYPHDCKNLAGFAGGHQGDPEQVMVDLYSYDLRTWYLAGAAYPAHGHTPVPYMSGAWLESRARELGTSWISVTADEDSHGSWMGSAVTSSHCAGSEDDYCASTCDCFENTWQWDFNNGYVEAVSANRNIGGPTPETWNASVLTVSGSDAYSQLDVGHGLNREYWTPRSDQYKKNCGWECPAAYRQSDGNCSLTIHDRSGCSSHLSEKVDRTNSCFEPGVNHCGGAGVGSGCYCDASCKTYGDCCADACSICGVC